MFACGIVQELFYRWRMFENKLHGLKVAGLWVGCTMRLYASDFVAPADGPVAFRRDQVPLDVTLMEELSQGFSVAAEASAMKTASDRRQTAQMLALAVALNPANTKARSLIEDFTDGKHDATGGADAGEIESYRVAIWQSISWLETAEAGSQGQALAACLKDVVIFFDPEDPRAQTFREAGERGAWSGWVPPLAAYESKEAAVTPEIPSVEPASTPPPLTTATLATLVWEKEPDSDNGRKVLKNTSIQMAAEKKVDDDAGESPFTLVIGSPAAADAASRQITRIQRLLKKQHNELPLGLQVTLSGKGLDEVMRSNSSRSNSAALAVLASAAVTGRELGDVTIIGNVDAAGAFSLSEDFWSQLQSLESGKDRRLVLPLAAAEYLPSMLALERQRIFMDYEILLAADFKQLLDLTAKIPDASLAKASEQFREICRKGATQPLREYVANLFVRRRLAEIVQQTPYHYSAKMLEIQGTGNRPTIIGRNVLIAELRLAIEPMEWILKESVYEFEPEQIEQFGTIYESCRVRVDGLVRYIDKDERALLSKVQDLVGGIRVLDRAAKSRGESYEVLDVMDEAQKTLIRSHAALMGELNPKLEGK